ARTDAARANEKGPAKRGLFYFLRPFRLSSAAERYSRFCRRRKPPCSSIVPFSRSRLSAFSFPWFVAADPWPCGSPSIRGGRTRIRCRVELGYSRFRRSDKGSARHP